VLGGRGAGSRGDRSDLSIRRRQEYRGRRDVDEPPGCCMWFGSMSPGPRDPPEQGPLKETENPVETEITNATAAEVNPPLPLPELSFKATSARMAREEARAKYVKELTITPNTMLRGLHRYGLHEFDSPASPLIDQITFIAMACEEHEKMKKTIHKPLTVRPTPITPSTKPQPSPTSAGDDT